MATERRRRKTPKNTCCALYLLRTENETPGQMKKTNPSSHLGEEGKAQKSRSGPATGSNSHRGGWPPPTWDVKGGTNAQQALLTSGTQAVFLVKAGCRT